MLGCVYASGCVRKDNAANSAHEAVDKSDSLPQSVKLLVKAVTDDDSVRFAEMVSYPLQRPYPLHDIANADDMKKYYRNIVDDSLRSVISHGDASRWKEFGWRGWSLDDGRYIWLDDSIYDVQYISQKERNAIDSLTREEVNSLPEVIRKGWKPVMCLLHPVTGSIYRIDARDEEPGNDKRDYRLAVYLANGNLKDLPDQLISGKKETEGAAGTVTYKFIDADGSDYVIEQESPETGNPALITRSDSIIQLQRAYWHELIKRDGHRDKKDKSRHPRDKQKI